MKHTNKPRIFILHATERSIRHNTTINSYLRQEQIEFCKEEFCTQITVCFDTQAHLSWLANNPTHYNKNT